MTLLEEIQAEAVDSKSDLAMLLRKLKILAARLGSQDMEDWLIWESNGYPTNVVVPEYRTWSLQIKGHFSGYAGAAIRNASVPHANLPKHVRESYSKYQFRDSIASVQDILKKTKSGVIQVSTGDLALALGMKVYQHYNCMQAWAEFSPNQLVELMNTVRNRVLDLSIALWKQDPHAGELSSGSSPVLEAKTVTQIFNTTVLGGTANLVGSATNSNLEFNITEGDFSTLEKILTENGVLQSDLATLRTAISSDPRPDSPAKLGASVSEWVGRMISKAASGAWEIGVNAAGSLLAQAIAKYYGF